MNVTDFRCRIYLGIIHSSSSGGVFFRFRVFPTHSNVMARIVKGKMDISIVSVQMGDDTADE